MENIFNAELIEKARQAKSPEELLALAKENEITLSEEEAKAYFEKLNKSGELADDELDSVAGGGCGSSTNLGVFVPEFHTCDLWCCRDCGKGKDEHRTNNIKHPGISEQFYCCDCRYYQFRNYYRSSGSRCYNPSV